MRYLRFSLLLITLFSLAVQSSIVPPASTINRDPYNKSSPDTNFRIQQHLYAMEPTAKANSFGIYLLGGLLSNLSGENAETIIHDFRHKALREAVVIHLKRIDENKNKNCLLDAIRLYSFLTDKTLNDGKIEAYPNLLTQLGIDKQLKGSLIKHKDEFIYQYYELADFLVNEQYSYPLAMLRNQKLPFITDPGKCRFEEVDKDQTIEMLIATTAMATRFGLIKQSSFDDLTSHLEGYYSDCLEETSDYESEGDI